MGDIEECDLFSWCEGMPRDGDSYTLYHRLYKAATEGNLTGVTEPQVKEFCKMHAASLICNANNLQTCLPKVPRLALQGFLQDTIALGSVCDRADLYATTKVLAACAQTVDSIHREQWYRGSRNRSVSDADHRRYFREVNVCTIGAFRPTANALGPFLIDAVYEYRTEYKQENSTATVQKNVCCVLKTLSTCLPALAIIRDKCTTEFIDLAKSIFSAALQHYACTEELSTVSCPSIAGTI